MQHSLFNDEHRPDADNPPETNSPADVQIEPSWKKVLKDEFAKDYFKKIKYFLQEEKQKGAVIYPPGKLIFNAYNLTPFDRVKVVILGQDPYHGPAQAHGLCFSVPDGIHPPPSLVNIFKEIKNDLDIAPPKSGNLEKWAREGVFLLNAMLTVKKDAPASHQAIGWQNFTDATIAALSDRREHLVFMLWGAFAQQKSFLIDDSKHLVLKAPHPSPFSADRGFFGSKHFSKANAYLQSNGLAPVDWKLS